MTCGGTYQTVSSIMGVGDVVMTPYSVIVLVMEIKITILRGKLNLALALAENNISLECTIMH